MTQGGSGREGGRSLKSRVKTARSRTLSSTLWLQRQLNDPYVARAKREGYRSRAAYKLLEIDARAHILKPGQKIVDLGAAPGGWSQVAAAKIGAGKTGAAQSKGKVFAIDLLPMRADAGRRIQADGFSRSGGARATARMARRSGRCRLVRHGRQCDRP